MNQRLITVITYGILLGGTGVVLFATLSSAADPRDEKLRAGLTRYAAGEVTELLHLRRSRKSLHLFQRFRYEFKIHGTIWRGEDRSLRFFGPTPGQRILIRFKTDEPAINRFDSHLRGEFPQPHSGWDTPPEN